jgi:TonB family protein
MFSDSAAKSGEPGAPARSVQVGGFGDPNGTTANARPGKIANIASLGAFDLPSGGGGGAGGRDGNGRSVQSAGFGDLNAKPTSSGTGGGGRSLEPIETPVEILFKPRPDYTQAARQLRLEGEVSLRVLFRANGEVRVMDVVRSLGHGLDENAVRAAQQIRFKPAMRQGQPVDSTATVHILFQLAY